jgi:hypothetical protein
VNGDQTQHKTDHRRQARNKQRLQPQQRQVREQQRTPGETMVELAYVCGGTESGGEAHLQVAFKVAEHGDKYEELVYTPEDAPAGEVFEELACEDEADQ